MKKISSVKELIKLSIEQDLNCFILLNGNLRSSKNIFYNSKTKIFEVENYIDDTTQFLKEKELYSKSNIGEAINKGSFFIS